MSEKSRISLGKFVSISISIIIWILLILASFGVFNNVLFPQKYHIYQNVSGSVINCDSPYLNPLGNVSCDGHWVTQGALNCTDKDFCIYPARICIGTQTITQIQSQTCNITKTYHQQEVDLNDYSNWTFDDCYNKFWDGDWHTNTTAYHNYEFCSMFLAYQNGNFKDSISNKLEITPGCSQINSSAWTCGDYEVIKE